MTINVTSHLRWLVYYSSTEFGVRRAKLTTEVDVVIHVIKIGPQFRLSRT